MNNTALLPLIIAAFMIMPAHAQAARGDDNSYKPKQERMGKGKARNKNKAGKQGNKDKKGKQGKKAAKAKNTPKVHVERRPHNKIIVHKRPAKKKKFRKFKRFVKKSLRAFENYGPIYRHNTHRRHGGWEHHCVPKHVMRARLVRRGWHDFDLIRRGPHRIRLEATNFKGRRFRLVLNRCTGHIVKKRPIRRHWRYGY